jgi:hypothetical protein
MIKILICCTLNSLPYGTNILMCGFSDNPIYNLIPIPDRLKNTQIKAIAAGSFHALALTFVHKL